MPDTLYEGDKSTTAVCAAGATTVRLRTAMWVKLPDVAVRLICEVAAAAELLTVNRPSKPEATALKEAVTPVGSPETDIATLPANPLSGVRETALAPFVPWTTCKLPGASAIVKSGGAVTVTVIV